jgi:hypothetical protein
MSRVMIVIPSLATAVVHVSLRSRGVSHRRRRRCHRIHRYRNHRLRRMRRRRVRQNMSRHWSRRRARCRRRHWRIRMCGRCHLPPSIKWPLSPIRKNRRLAVSLVRSHRTWQARRGLNVRRRRRRGPLIVRNRCHKRLGRNIHRLSIRRLSDTGRIRRHWDSSRSGNRSRSLLAVLDRRHHSRHRVPNRDHLWMSRRGTSIHRQILRRLDRVRRRRNRHWRIRMRPISLVGVNLLIRGRSSHRNVLLLLWLPIHTIGRSRWSSRRINLAIAYRWR